MSLSRQARRRSFGLALAISLVALPLPAAAAPPTAPQPPQWTTVDSTPPGSSLKKLQGVSDGAGNCKYDINLALAPGQDAIYGRQIRHDPSQCLTEVAELHGQAAIDAIKAAESEDQSKGATKTGKGTPKAGQRTPESTQPDDSEIGPLSHSYINSQGHLRTLWEDPFDITVAEVTNTVNWSWNNHNCLEPGWGSYRYYWYSPSGWRLEENNFGNWYWCDRQESSSYAHFFNGAFCVGADTHAYWDRNWVWGYWDGWLRGRWNTWVSGGCTGFLSFEYHFVRDKN